MFNDSRKDSRRTASKSGLESPYASLDTSCGQLFHVPKLPNAAYRSSDLKIAVPHDGEFKLAEAIDLSSEKEPRFTNAQVSQLPTPIISGGGFATMLVPPKRSSRGESAGSGRAVSEFVPNHYDHKNVAEKKGLSSRNVSNPLEFKTPESSLTIPLPPIELETKVSEELIYSPSLRTYFAPGPTIGTGSFSTVVQARQISDPEIVVAIKIISVPTSDLASITNFKSYITRELSILTYMQHPCIVKLYDYNLTMNISGHDIERSFHTFSTSKSAESFHQNVSELRDELERLLDENDLRISNKQYYFLQYCPGGNLFQYLDQYYNIVCHETQFWTLVTRITAELIVSVSYLHSQRVVHRDIKLENILLNKKFDADTDSYTHLRQGGEILTLTDFGLSKRIAYKNQLLTTKCGSQDYVSPELLMGLEYDGILLDSWAVGVVVYAILENRLPFDAPPLEFMDASNISPSVIKRRRARHNPSYRIAMIDWDWYRTLALLDNVRVSDASKALIKNLMAVVDALLVRKEKRSSVSDLLHNDDFIWIRQVVPPNVLNFDKV